MKRKGFTLVELLAIIVIIGIIALIAVPVVNGLIEESRLGAFKASSFSVFEAYSNYQAENGFNEPGRLVVSDLSLNNKEYFVSGIIDKNNEDEIYVSELSNAIYCANGTKTDLRIVRGSCEMLDLTPPVILSVTSESTTNSITVYVTYSEEESSIFKHEYRIVKEGEDIENALWVSGDTLTENLSTKFFSNLEQGQKYKVQVKLTNIAIENSESDIYELIVSTVAIEKPVIFPLTDREFATSKEVQITYPEGNGFTYQYSLDGKTWMDTHDRVTKIVVEENGTISARVYDGYNYVYAIPVTISGIDRTKPVVTITKNVVDNKNVLTAIVEPENTLSGYTYTWYKDGNVLSSERGKNLTVVSAGNYKVKITTGAGVEVESEFTIRDYTIVYQLNGGSGSIPNQTKIEDISLSLTSVIPIREGYEFQGWGVTNSDKVATYTGGSVYTKNEGITLYAIWKKGYTITFASNGATLSETTKSCEVYNAETSCQITTPTITRSGYSIIGYGESASAKTSLIGSNATLTVSGNKTYYAVTSKILTANFNKNTVSSISATSSSCTIYNTEVSCTPTLPTIIPQANFTNRNWGTSASQTGAGVTSITLNVNNTGSTWYALNSREITWKFDKNAVNRISKNSVSCMIWNASASCQITTPTITAVSGYTVIGFGGSKDATTSSLNPNMTVTFTNSTTNQTYYALQKKTVTITYDGNDAVSGSVDNQSCTMYNASTSCQVTTKGNGYSKPGYSFSGWSTGTVVSHQANTSYPISNNTTLKAIWSIQTPTITGGSTSWATSRTISIMNAPSNLSKIARYEYYYTTSSTAPTSATAATGNIGTATSKVFNTNFNGYYIYFRAVGTDGSVSSWSAGQRLYVDVNSPTITAKGSSYTIAPKANNVISSTYFNLGQNGNSGITSIVCTSNIDGTITNTSTLSTNNSSNKSHTITCTVTKANGKTATASTTIVVQSYCSSTTSTTSWGSCNVSCGYGTQSGTVYYKSSYDSSISCGNSSTSQSCYAGKPCSYAATANYSCPSGYDSNGSGSSMTCSKRETVSNISNTTYSCPSGGSLSGKICTLTIDKTWSCSSGDSISGQTCTSTIDKTWSCLSGDSISGQTCTSIMDKIWDCPSGYDSSGSGSSMTCSKNETVSPTVTYSCSSGIKSGSKCYSCPSGGTLSGTTCTKTISSSVSSCSKCLGVCFEEASGHYACEVKSTYTASSSNATANYSCPSGYNKSGSGSNTTCSKRTNVSPISSCPSGYNKSGYNCVKTYSATSSCPSGYNKSGYNCVKTYSATSSCPSGYDKSGYNCVKTYSATGTTNYSCPIGYNPSGSGSSMQCSKTVPTSNIVTYSCPSGGSLSGTTCYY